MVKKTKQSVVEDDDLSIDDLIAAATADEDQSIESVGGGDSTPAPEGPTMARLIEYVELGLQPQRPYMGKEKPPSEEVNIVLELLSPDNMREVEVNGEMKVFTDKIYITVTKKMSGRAKFFKLFNAMRYGRDSITHMAQMLGEAFIVDVTHGSSKNNPGKIYVNIGTKDDVGIRGPFETDLKTRKKIKVDVPEPTQPIKIFLQNKPTMKTWNSLFIDGEYEKDGEVKSKNFIQNKILSSPSFEGSALQALLDGTDNLPALEEDNLDDVGVEEEVITKGRNVSVKKPVSVQQNRARSVTESASQPVKTVKTASPSKGKVASVGTKLNTSMLTKPTVQKKASTKDAFKAIGLEIK